MRDTLLDYDYPGEQLLWVHPATTIIQQMSSEHHRTNQSTKRVKRDC